jgi:hypothetical protein
MSTEMIRALMFLSRLISPREENRALSQRDFFLFNIADKGNRQTSPSFVPAKR